MFVFFFTLDIFSFARNKLQLIDIYNDIRISRGFIIFSTFNYIDIFFGIDSTLSEYVFNRNFTWVNDHIKNNSERLLGYVTSYSGVLVKYGLFSFFLLNRAFIKLLRMRIKI